MNHFWAGEGVIEVQQGNYDHDYGEDHVEGHKGHDVDAWVALVVWEMRRRVWEFGEGGSQDLDRLVDTCSHTTCRLVNMCSHTLPYDLLNTASPVTESRAQLLPRHDLGYAGTETEEWEGVKYVDIQSYEIFK